MIIITLQTEGQTSRRIVERSVYPEHYVWVLLGISAAKLKGAVCDFQDTDQMQRPHYFN